MEDNLVVEQLFLLLIFIGLPIFIFKVLIPLFARVYKLWLIIFGTLICWTGFLGTYFLLKEFPDLDMTSRFLVPSIVAIILVTPTFIIASLIGRIESLEEKIKEILIDIPD